MKWNQYRVNATYNGDLDNIIEIVFEIAEDDQRRSLQLLLLTGEIIPQMALCGCHFAQVPAQRLDRKAWLGVVSVQHQSQSGTSGRQSVAGQIRPARSSGGWDGQ